MSPINNQTMRRRMGHAARLVLSAALLAGLTACSQSADPAAGRDERPVQERVGERALERWQALIQGDVDKAYGYFSPGWRNTTSPERYRASLGGAVQWKDVQLASVSCQAEVCDVGVKISYQYSSRLAGGVAGETLINEKWINSDDQWWYLPKG